VSPAGSCGEVVEISENGNGILEEVSAFEQISKQRRANMNREGIERRIYHDLDLGIFSGGIPAVDSQLRGPSQRSRGMTCFG
jgi:hypothetical protein